MLFNISCGPHKLVCMLGNVLWHVFPHLCEGILELLCSLSSNVAAPNGLKHNVAEMFNWI